MSFKKKKKNSNNLHKTIGNMSQFHLQSLQLVLVLKSLSELITWTDGETWSSEETWRNNRCEVKTVRNQRDKHTALLFCGGFFVPLPLCAVGPRLIVPTRRRVSFPLPVSASRPQRAQRSRSVLLTLHPPHTPQSHWPRTTYTDHSGRQGHLCFPSRPAPSKRPLTPPSEY